MSDAVKVTSAPTAIHRTGAAGQEAYWSLDGGGGIFALTSKGEEGYFGNAVGTIKV